MRRRTATVGTAAVALLGAVVVWLVANRVFPYHSLNHDEGVYLQQAAMLLEGRLFLRPPVEGVFRPWFFVESERGLYPKYAPLPAVMFALGKLAGGYRLALVGVAAGNLALVAGVVREAFDRPTALVAALFVLASPLFVLNSSVFLPYAPTTLLNLCFAYCYLRADRTGDLRWAAAAGAAVGLAFFSRPYTAVLFASPFVAHALWTLRRDFRGTLSRQATTAALGLLGVAVALGYNAVTTGSPIVFPYEAFAPLDGLGFGERRILDHGIEYTPTLALRANGRVLWQFFGEWIAGGLVGAALAAGGLAVAVRRGLGARQAPLAGLFLTVPAGNVYFWGNFNVLGDLDRAGDGLIAALGPYYHFDLLLPTATFAAVGALALARVVRDALADRPEFDARAARVGFAAVLLVTAGVVGAVTVGNAEGRIERNAEVTETYETAYEPFEGGPPANSVVLLPDPYGDWLNHPFQALRNDPGYDGRAVYAIGDRPFETADAFPNRTLYRYVYRGPWAPFDGSPRAARLQRVADVSGSALAMNATVGVPAGADAVTFRLGTDEGSAYHVAGRTTDAASVELRLSDGTVRLAGPGAPSNETLSVSGRETVRLSAFVDYGPGGSFTYRFDLPVDASDGRVRALTPRVELCRGARSCGGEAAYLPERAPDGVFVETNLTASERNP
ncbi:ArnT family glycosyltransferase [Halosimplex aquaticum]|uniref:ArnT family glycosyltransferase n=1 Tax=Halosimplex aquaticum TaxID=3026162 RepID=A0ABD5XXC7_9EURY|nr:glycosyltransferase family 39 protein [Halosimplex aquaticum]